MRKLAYAPYYSYLSYLLFDVIFFAALYLLSTQVAYAYPGENCVKEDMSCQDKCLSIPLTSPEFKPCSEGCTKSANECIDRERAAAEAGKEHAEPPSKSN